MAQLTLGTKLEKPNAALKKSKVSATASCETLDKDLQDRCTNLVHDLERRISDCQRQKEFLKNNVTQFRASEEPFINNLTPSNCAALLECYTQLKRAFEWLSTCVVRIPTQAESRKIAQCVQYATVFVGFPRNFVTQIFETTLHTCATLLLEIGRNAGMQNVPWLNTKQPAPSIKEFKTAKKNLETLIGKTLREKHMNVCRQTLEQGIRTFQNAFKAERQPEAEELQTLIQGVLDPMQELSEKFNVNAASPGIRELFQPILPYFPEENDYPAIFYEIQQAVDLIKSKEDSFEEESAPISEAVKEVRKSLIGKTIVLVGGTPVAHIRKRFEETYGCSVRWEKTSHGQSLKNYDSLIQSKNVPLFLIFVKWASHAHNEELVTAIHKGGKKAVRLHTATNPAAIAVKIQELGISEE